MPEEKTEYIDLEDKEGWTDEQIQVFNLLKEIEMGEKSAGEAFRDLMDMAIKAESEV